MTRGQQRALHELKRLSAAGQNEFELLDEALLENGRLVVTISLYIGVIEAREEGLDLREREEFTVSIPPGFPFDRPSLRVRHARFAGFSHIIWAKTICLYQSSIEWNPSDAMYGFFDRLNSWLGKAAINDMDPMEGPLEPPHHDTDFSQAPFVIRANAPCAAGESWIGLALLEKHINRTELVAWNDLSQGWPQHSLCAFSVILPKAFPTMEFPTSGKEFFEELGKAGVERENIVRTLALAALLCPEGQPIHLIIGLPMRRATDGSQRLHIAVWTTDADMAESLRHVLPENADNDKLLKLRQDLSDSLTSLFELGQIKWCHVLEDRDEIVVRRDSGTPISWFTGKRILILGCGALGSWAAEILTRTKPSFIDLVDNGIVKPGVLARQNFELDDIGAPKAKALARRLSNLAHGPKIIPYVLDAHTFITEQTEHLNNYDVVLDCTASSIFQMKLERDWADISENIPPFISLIVDGQAKHCLCVITPKGSAGSVWDAYLSLKRRLCIEGDNTDLTTAFYSDRAIEMMFQPEPGCSDPTFSGSTADVVGLASNALNIAVGKLQTINSSAGVALSLPKVGSPSVLESFELPQFYDAIAGNYRVRISKRIFTQAQAWVRQNNRLRSPGYETGGLLWGVWDDAIEVIWIFDLSGPPPDSQHNPSHFLCGVQGTVEEHKRRMERTHGACGFIGHWHTHPNLPSEQSDIDRKNMAKLVSSLGQNQKRSVMLIIGRTGGVPTAGIYIYESQSLTSVGDLISVGMSQIILEKSVV